MTHRRPRFWITAGFLLGGAYLFAGGNLTCGSFAADAAVSGLDMCFIFDCTNGIFGGVIDPCSQIEGSDSGGGGQAGGADTETGGTFFTDCPDDDLGGG
jgi:hypothetical protein